MKRVLSTLAIASAISFALPAFAAPSVVEKHQIPVPKMDSNLLKTASSFEFTYSYTDFDRNYVTKKGKNLPVKATLLKEIDCQNTTYRDWSIGIDTSALSKRVGYLVSQFSTSVEVIEARQAGNSKWKMFNPKTDYSSSVINCASGNRLLINRLKDDRSAYIGVMASYETFSNDSIWKNPKYPNMPTGYTPYSVDGVKQLPGHLSIYASAASSAAKPIGDSRVVVLDGPSEGLHSLPWYRDLTNLTLSPGESYYISFYRLSDGYGVVETHTPGYNCTVSPCAYPPPVTTNYRIHDGESVYSVVASLPLPALFNNEMVGVYGSGMNIYASLGYAIDLTFHDLPESVRNSSLRDQNYGFVAWENAKQIVVRYYIVLSKTNIQYWQAVIQK